LLHVIHTPPIPPFARSSIQAISWISVNASTIHTFKPNVNWPIKYIVWNSSFVVQLEIIIFTLLVNVHVIMEYSPFWQIQILIQNLFKLQIHTLDFKFTIHKLLSWLHLVCHCIWIQVPNLTSWKTFAYSCWC